VETIRYRSDLHPLVRYMDIRRRAKQHQLVLGDAICAHFGCQKTTSAMNRDQNFNRNYKISKVSFHLNRSSCQNLATGAEKRAKWIERVGKSTSANFDSIREISPVLSQSEQNSDPNPVKFSDGRLKLPAGRSQNLSEGKYEQICALFR
jgi:hypothetical protein